MNTVVMKQKDKIHPHKFTLWVALGSIVMMFAGLTSADIVKRNQANWAFFFWLFKYWALSNYGIWVIPYNQLCRTRFCM